MGTPEEIVLVGIPATLVAQLDDVVRMTGTLGEERSRDDHVTDAVTNYVEGFNDALREFDEVRRQFREEHGE